MSTGAPLRRASEPAARAQPETTARPRRDRARCDRRPRDDETGEAKVHLDAFDLEAGSSQRALGGRNEAIDGFTRQAEEVEVARLAINVPAGDQGGSAGESELLCLLETRDDLRDLLLERAEQLSAVGMPPEPTVPRAPDGWRQHELVEDLTQLIDVHVEADVVLVALAENLLVDADPVGALVEVVAHRRTASADVEGQLDHSARLRHGRAVHVLGHYHRPSRGPKIRGACLRHPAGQCTARRRQRRAREQERGRTRLLHYES